MPVATAIADLDAARLDRFGEVLFDAPFLSFVEDEQRGRSAPRYFFLEAGAQLSAFAVGYVYTGAPIPFSFRLEEFLGPGAGELLGAAPRYLVVGVPIRLRSRVLADDAAAQAALVELIVEHARDEGLDGVAFSFVHASDARLVATLRDAGFASAFYEGDFYLPVGGAATLEERLAAMPPRPRTQLRNDLNRFRRAGLRVELTTDLTSHAAELTAQHRALMDHYGRTPELDEASFARFERHVPRRSLALARDGDGAALAFVLATFSATGFEVLRFGRRADLDVSARVYGTLVFTEQLRQAIALGCTRVHMGKASQRAKTLRGCAYEEGIVFARWLAPGPHARIARALEELDDANRRRFARACRGDR